MAKSRRANAVVFGFDFQVNAAIVLMIENIEDLKSLRLEGNYEDIEIELENNQYILAQAKAVERSSSDFRNVRKNLEKSLISLSEGNQKVDAQRLILITNSPNPLNEEASRSIFWGDAHREFLSLPESSQELIRRYLDNINQPLDTDKFMIQILPFETDNDIERYKVVTLYEKAEENRIVREAREEAERKRVEEARCREENRQRKEQEIRLVKELVNKAEDYRIAKEIREYIQAMIDSGNEDITPEWIEWALKKADWYDPSIETEDEYLGKRQHEKSAEEKEKSLQDSIRKSWYW